MTGSGHEHCSRPDGSSAELRVVDVLRRVIPELLRENQLSPEQRRLLALIRDCRTPALGGEVLVCPDCGLEKEVYHSCRNRHCPNCQAQAQDQWIAARAAAMLPVPHFHVVFTLPAPLRSLCQAAPRAMFDLLLRSCGDVLIDLGRDTLGAQLGVTVILHTWTRDLSFHVHAHCIVSAGGWKAASATFQPVPNRRFLFPQARLKALFRARILRGLRGLVQQGVVTLPGEGSFSRFEKSLPPKRRWVVHAQAPFGRFAHVLAYLGRYTHRVGISNARLRAVSKTHVTFATRDGKTCTLTHRNFALRFLQHVLPAGFKKIRHYGLYASGAKQRQLALSALAPATPLTPDQAPAAKTPRDETLRDDTRTLIWRERCCPNCGVPFRVVAQFPRPTRCRGRPP